MKMIPDFQVCATEHLKLLCANVRGIRFHTSKQSFDL